MTKIIIKCRVAGNVLDEHALGSIEYAVEHLGSQLLVVLGHQKCGACKAGTVARTNANTLIKLAFFNQSEES